MSEQDDEAAYLKRQEGLTWPEVAALLGFATDNRARHAAKRHAVRIGQIAKPVNVWNGRHDKRKAVPLEVKPKKNIVIPPDLVKAYLHVWDGGSFESAVIHIPGLEPEQAESVIKSFALDYGFKWPPVCDP